MVALLTAANRRGKGALTYVWDALYEAISKLKRNGHGWGWVAGQGVIPSRCSKPLPYMAPDHPSLPPSFCNHLSFCLTVVYQSADSSLGANTSRRGCRYRVLR